MLFSALAIALLQLAPAMCKSSKSHEVYYYTDYSKWGRHKNLIIKAHGEPMKDAHGKYMKRPECECVGRFEWVRDGCRVKKDRSCSKHDGNTCEDSHPKHDGDTDLSSSTSGCKCKRHRKGKNVKRVDHKRGDWKKVGKKGKKYDWKEHNKDGNKCGCSRCRSMEPRKPCNKKPCNKKWSRSDKSSSKSHKSKSCSKSHKSSSKSHKSKSHKECSKGKKSDCTSCGKQDEKW